MLNENWLDIFDKSYKAALANGCFGSFSTSPVALATASQDGLPSCRMVLLKNYNPNGFIIYTNIDSRKGKELQQNQNAALTFYWPEINCQIAVKGKVKFISDTDSDNYFSSRPFFSKVGAHASAQSQPIKYRMEFLLRIIFYSIKFFLLAGKVPRPGYWKGFAIIPEKMDLTHTNNNNLN